MIIVRTQKEINKYIEKLLSDSSNFVSDNYGSEASDNGFYEERFDSYLTRNTLNNFIKWLTNKKIK